MVALRGTPPRTLLCNSRLNNFVTLRNARKRRFAQVSSLWRDVPRKGVKTNGQKLTGQKARMTGKQKARIWCAIITNTAPIIRALAALLVVLILIG